MGTHVSLQPGWAPLLRRAAGLVAALLPLAAFALDPTRTLTQYRCANWSRQNGLAVSSVNAITQTTDGYLWLGTQQGLVRFDGFEFKSVPIPRTPLFVSQNIWTLSHCRDGGLWFGLREGAVGYFDGYTVAPLRAPWVEPNMQVFDVNETDDGTVWVAWNFGVARWNPDARPEHNQASIGTVCYRTVYHAPGGRTWAAAADPGRLYYWDGGERKEFTDASLGTGNIFAVAVDARGWIWMGTQAGLRCYDADFHRVELPELGAVQQVNALLIDRHGVLWIGTEGDGLIRHQDGHFTRFTTLNGLVNDFVSALYEDAEGNLWAGTRSGLTQLSDVKFPLLAPPDMLAGEPIGVAAATNGGLWVATAKGLTLQTATESTTFGIEAGLPNVYVKRAWQATSGDVYVIDGDRGLSILADGKVVRRHVRKDWPIAMAEDANGMLVSFGGELCRVTRDEVVPYSYQGGVAPEMVWAVNLWPARDGAVWVASHRGVWRIKDGRFQQWSIHNGLSGTVANWVFEDTDGTVWAGLATGLARFRDGQVRCLNRADGLFDNFIYAIVPDRFGYFWIDSSAGIFRVARENLNAVADGRESQLRCEAFDGQEAVKSIDKHSQEQTAATTRDGRIWFATAAGVIVVDPARIPHNALPPPVYIQTAHINGVDAGGAVQAGRGDLEFHYTAVSFIAPDKIRFRYRLEGYDDHWVDAGDRRSAFYTNLKPGAYRFRVQACNADGVWNESGAVLALTLPPHVYQTTWFLAAAGVMGGLLLVAVYVWRIGALRRRQRNLQEMNALLDAKVHERTTELADANRLLRDEIAERQRFEREADQMNHQLVLASREAGMAEVATSVLHNVGNVLNSVNVSASVIRSHLRDSRGPALRKVAALLASHADTPGFLSQDEKGRKIPAFLESVAAHMAEQYSVLLREVDSLRKNIAHIEDIVQMQQSYSRLQATRETVAVTELVDDAIRLSGAGLSHHRLSIVSDVAPNLTVETDKPKVLQILVNLLRNAIHACKDNGAGDTIRVGAAQVGDCVRLEVQDNGMGIPAENLPRLFTQGFTTRKEGHGYGLHSSAIAAKAMGATLSASSPGPGQGATFTLDLPIAAPLRFGANGTRHDPGAIVIGAD